MPAMSKIFSAGALLAALISSVAGHTYVETIEVGGKSYAGFYSESINTPGKGADGPAWRTNQGTGLQPVMGDQINHPNIIAHLDAIPSPNTAPAEAGSNVKFTWFHKGECQGGETGETGWDCSHHGWTTTWLAPCNGDCANVDKESLKFFKIHEQALLSYPEGTRFAEGSTQAQTGFWGTDAIFYENGNSQEVTLPSNIPSGNYVLRTEVTSIHNNEQLADRQLWPQAFNIEITGGDDSASVPDGVVGTEIYSTDDALLNWDLYWHDGGANVIPTAPGPELASVATSSKARRNHARDFSS